MESYKKPQIYSNRGIWASQDIPDCSKDFICSHKRFITAITQNLVRYDFQLKFDWRTFQFHEWANEEHHCGLFVVLQARPNSLKPQLDILSGSDGCRAVIMKLTNKVPLRNPRLVWFHFMALVVSLNIWPTCSTISVGNEWTKLMPIYVGRTRSVIIR